MFSPVRTEMVDYNNQELIVMAFLATPQMLSAPLHLSVLAECFERGRLFPSPLCGGGRHTAAGRAACPGLGHVPDDGLQRGEGTGPGCACLWGLQFVSWSSLSSLRFFFI